MVVWALAVTFLGSWVVRGSGCANVVLLGQLCNQILSLAQWQPCHRTGTEWLEASPDHLTDRLT
ncbi:MAG: hypothetical protein QHJ34_16075 [bacterium]|nr:hypothetical protein [candidate division KSB1 bacterium]MDH7561721.1 hypothetical protein [bacterium]